MRFGIVDKRHETRFIDRLWPLSTVVHLAKRQMREVRCVTADDPLSSSFFRKDIEVIDARGTATAPHDTPGDKPATGVEVGAGAKRTAEPPRGTAC